MTTAIIMWFIFGISLGAIIPTVFALKTVFRSILIETRGYKQIEKRLSVTEKEVQEMLKSVNADVVLTCGDCVEYLREEDWLKDRQDLPYDAMGDYPGTSYARPADAESTPTGTESPDDWYRAECGGDQ